MFATQVATYNDDPMIGGTTGSRAHYDPNSRCTSTSTGWRTCARRTRRSPTARRRPVRERPGRHLRVQPGRPQGQVEYLVVANNATTPKIRDLLLTRRRLQFARILGGSGSLTSTKDGQVSVSVPPLTVQVYRAKRAIPQSHVAPTVTFASPAAGGVLAGRAEIRAAVPANTPVQVSFAYRPVGTTAVAAARHRRQCAVPRLPGREFGCPRAPCSSTARL